MLLGTRVTSVRGRRVGGGRTRKEGKEENRRERRKEKKKGRRGWKQSNSSHVRRVWGCVSTVVDRHDIKSGVHMTDLLWSWTWSCRRPS